MMSTSDRRKKEQDLFFDGELIRAGVTRPFVSPRLGRDDEEVGTIRAEEHCSELTGCIPFFGLIS